MSNEKVVLCIVCQRVSLEDDIDFAISVMSQFSVALRLVSATNMLSCLLQLLFIDCRGECLKLLYSWRSSVAVMLEFVYNCCEALFQKFWLMY